jgi:hypothetical protein
MDPEMRKYSSRGLELDVYVGRNSVPLSRAH